MVTAVIRQINMTAIVTIHNHVVVSGRITRDYTVRHIEHHIVLDGSVEVSYTLRRSVTVTSTGRRSIGSVAIVLADYRILLAARIAAPLNPHKIIMRGTGHNPSMKVHVFDGLLISKH